MFKSLFGQKNTGADLFELLKADNVQIIDVRTESEFEGGHVKNSKNIPVDQVPNHLEEFKAMPKPIILCCASGARSGMATDFLTRSGVEEVYNGGSWKNVELQLLK
jgi:rhodanese-related sulfurtransferase